MYTYSRMLPFLEVISLQSYTEHVGYVLSSLAKSTIQMLTYANICGYEYTVAENSHLQFQKPDGHVRAINSREEERHMRTRKTARVIPKNETTLESSIRRPKDADILPYLYCV